MFYSAEDEAYIANVPAFNHLSAHGETPADAVNEVDQALKAVLKIMQEDGKEPPYSMKEDSTYLFDRYGN